MIGTCTPSASGTCSPATSSSPGCATRCALYDGMASTRKAGLQSLSQQATRCVGRPRSTNEAIMSSSPRTAFVGTPLGPMTSGTPKKARKYSDAESSRSIRGSRDGIRERLPGSRPRAPCWCSPCAYGPPMGRNRAIRLLAGAGCAGVLLSACSSPGDVAATSQSAPAPTAATVSPSPTPAPDRQIVALGDSVPYGTACGCTPYPQLTGAGLSEDPGPRTLTINDSRPGYTTSDVLEQLQSDHTVRTHIGEAEALLVEVGANDVQYSATCGVDAHCYDGAVTAMSQRLQQIVTRISQLTAGHRLLVVLLDYWSVWLGGQYAAARGASYVNAAAYVTDEVNTVVKARAEASQAQYVDLRKAFKGPDYAYDETHYLASDGDHPNAAGHQQIADATVAAIRAFLHP